MEKTEKNTSFVINETKKANSYEFGPAKNRHKIYYEDITELTRKIVELKEAGLYQDEDSN